MSKDDLIERLRAIVPYCEDQSDYTDDDRAILEAASTLLSQKEENERLKEALENLLIAIGMEWDLNGVVDVARLAHQGEQQ